MTLGLLNIIILLEYDCFIMKHNKCMQTYMLSYEPVEGSPGADCCP